jgi:hypothetical protein
MKTTAILIALLIFAFAFAQAAAFKFVFMGMDATAAEIAGTGFPVPHLLAWVAAFFEAALAIAFLTGLFFAEAAIVSILGPWAGPLEQQSDGVRVLYRPLHFHRRSVVRGSARARHRAGSAPAHHLIKRGSLS